MKQSKMERKTTVVAAPDERSNCDRPDVELAEGSSRDVASRLACAAMFPAQAPAVCETLVEWSWRKARPRDWREGVLNSRRLFLHCWTRAFRLSCDRVISANANWTHHSLNIFLIKIYINITNIPIASRLCTDIASYILKMHTTKK
jgi:hypothetical protein